MKKEEYLFLSQALFAETRPLHIPLSSRSASKIMAEIFVGCIGIGLGSCRSALSAATIIHSITGPAVGPIQHSLTSASTVPPLPPAHFPRSSSTLSAHTVRLPCVFGQMTNCSSSSRSSDGGREDSGGIKARRSRQMATGNGNGQGNLQRQLLLKWQRKLT